MQLLNGQTIAILSPVDETIGDTQRKMSDNIITAFKSQERWYRESQALYSSEILSLLTLTAAKGFLMVPFATVLLVEMH